MAATDTVPVIPREAGKLWVVEPYGWSAETFKAPTRDAAKYAAFKALREAGAYAGSDGFWRFLVNGISIRETLRNG